MQRLGIDQEEVGGLQHQLRRLDGLPELPDFARGEDHPARLGALDGRDDEGARNIVSHLAKTVERDQKQKSRWRDGIRNEMPRSMNAGEGGRGRFK